MILPKKVKVAYRDIAIEEFCPIKAAEAQRYGEYDNHKNVIRIDTSHGEVKAAYTLLHEIMHCVYFYYDMSQKDEEEAIVTKSSTGLIQVFRDNPDVMSYIFLCLTDPQKQGD